jgi:PAS domain S-box-containing protein/putative nucleotidyltransferase with HDIG domain
VNATPIRVLLLEDNPGDARLLQVVLSEHAPGEFSVVVVTSLAEALARLGSEPFDAVLSDLNVTDSEGLATVRSITGAAHSLPVVVLTGSTDDERSREAIRQGAQDYLIKAEASGALVARTLRHAIERHRLEERMRLANESLESRVAERTAELQSLLAEANEGRRALLSIMEDVGREAAERQKGEDRFRRLVDRSPDVLYRYSVKRGSLFYSERVVEVLGHTREQLYADPFLVGESIHLEDRARVAEALRLLLETGANFDIEYRIKDAQGEWHWLHDRSIALVEENGEAVIEGLAGDITGSKRDQEARRGAEEQIKRYVEQLQTAFMHAVEVATNLSEMRDPYTAGHEKRVAELAVAIGAELGFDERRQEGLRVAGYLHDVGKISVPAEILSKPGRLSDVEMRLIRTHAQAGYDVLKDVDFPWPVALVALQHHERLDGTGYPFGLKGEAILLEARIVAVADVMEAMSSHRPYRAGQGIEKSLAEVERGAGGVYDAPAAAACLRLFREKGFVFSAPAGRLSEAAAR